MKQAQFVFAYNPNWMNFWMSLSFSCSLRLPVDLWGSQGHRICLLAPCDALIAQTPIPFSFCSLSSHLHLPLFLVLDYRKLHFLDTSAFHFNFFFSMLISQKEGKRGVWAGDPAATWLYPQFCWLFSCNISMVCDMLWYNIIWYDRIQYNMIQYNMLYSII